MYKPELMTNYTPWFDPVPALPLSFTDIKQGETVCLEISKDLVPYLLGLLELARWKDRFDGTPEEQAHTVGVFQDLVSAMITGNADCKPCDSPVKIVKGKDTNTWDVRIEDTMAVINIYECGCGCGSHSSTGTKELSAVSGGGGSGGSGDSTNAISDVVVTPPPTATTSTLCDIVTGGMLDYVLQQVIEFLETAHTIAGTSTVPINAIIDASEIVPIIGTLTDAGWDALAQVLVIGTDAILDMLRDVDFQDKFKIAYIKGNPNDPGTNITRQNLLNAANKLPYTWLQGTVLIFPRLVMGALVNVIRMDKVRRRLALYEGQANAALCDFYYGEAGVAAPAAPTPSGEVRPLQPQIVGDYTIYFVDNPGTYRLGQSVTINVPSGIENIVMVGWVTGDPEPTAGPNQQELLADGALITTFPDTGSSALLAGESIVRSVVAANLDDFFPDRDNDNTQQQNVIYGALSPTQWRIQMRSDANPEIYRVIYRFIIVTENV